MLKTAPSETRKPPKRFKVALAGNPNTGKSTLFNALTGYHQRVGNYPGVTVERRAGLLRHSNDGSEVELIDLPGTYSLASHSADEAIVHDTLVGHNADETKLDLIVLVVDASNLGRNLFFASQIIDIGRPVVVALNMMDVATASGIRIDAKSLAKELGVPVIPVVAAKREGIAELCRSIFDSMGTRPRIECDGFPDVIHQEVQAFAESLAALGHQIDIQAGRVEALQVLLGPSSFQEQRLVRQHGQEILDEITQRRARIEAAGESLAEVEARVRYRWIDGVVQRTTSRERALRRSTTENIDRIVTHKLLGLLLFVGLMTLCFQAIYTWAGPLMDLIDRTVAVTGQVVASLFAEGALRSLVADGVIAGVGGVLVFLPQILILFLFLAILEDCGYMARAAFLLDRWMGFVGLSGNSFVPLLSSFACAVPGIMATRNIANRRDRLVTMLIAPLMSCSARLPVYVLLTGAFIPATPLLGGWVTLQAVVLLALYASGVVVAIGVAFVLKMTLLKGESQPFLLEMPTYKMPAVRTVLYRMYSQGKEFCVSAGTIIFAVTIVVWALGYYPHPPSIANKYDVQREAIRTRVQQNAQVSSASMDPTKTTTQRNETIVDEEKELAMIDQLQAGAYLRHSILGRMGRWIEPVVEPLGWDWRIGTAVIASFPAREVVIATMGTIYNLGDAENETSEGLRGKLRKATWPDGRPVFNAAVALSIMVFFALCCQCGATLATIKRETRSWRWPLATFVYMTALAYAAAFATYQIASRLT